jgi:diguanylate cyclase (GGDEF)-like protein
VVLDARVPGNGDRADARTVREVAQALRKGLRLGDSIGRWGEHRFFVLLPDSDPPAARIVTERMRALVQALQLRAPGNGELRRVSLLMGVAPAIPGDDAEDLVERCESALRASRAAARRRLSSRRPAQAA